MTNKEFLNIIRSVYQNRYRNVLEASAHLQVEASELSELFLKRKWYNKEFSNQDLLSEAGDILNFLTYILDSNGLSLEEAMINNKQKLIDRGYIK